MKNNAQQFSRDDFMMRLVSENFPIVLPKSALPFILFFLFDHAAAQFIDNFDNPALARDPSASRGWASYTGDGAATMNMEQREGYVSIHVDATKDQRNIWWALIRRRVTADLDLSKLCDSKWALRIAARIRVSHAPRRVNLHLNTQRTTDFHSHLMEFDIPDTVNWHAISVTTHGFEAQPGDSVYGQLALMDWGREKYRVDLDYVKVDIVHVDSLGPDHGEQVPYHPPAPSRDAFAHHLAVAHDAMIDIEYPNMNFNHWQTQDEKGKINLLTVSGTQFIIMRWDFGALAGKPVAGSGLLELTTYALQRSADNQKDFGMIRVVEILDGAADWDQKDVTSRSLCQGQAPDQVMNAQMIIDVAVAQKRGAKNFITLSKPVLQRMIDGKTRGLALRPLGAVHASFYAQENGVDDLIPKLHINVASK